MLSSITTSCRSSPSHHRLRLQNLYHTYGRFISEARHEEYYRRVRATGGSAAGVTATINILSRIGVDFYCAGDYVTALDDAALHFTAHSFAVMASLQQWAISKLLCGFTDTIMQLREAVVATDDNYKIYYSPKVL